MLFFSHNNKKGQPFFCDCPYFFIAILLRTSGAGAYSPELKVGHSIIILKQEFSPFARANEQDNQCFGWQCFRKYTVKHITHMSIQSLLLR